MHNHYIKAQEPNPLADRLYYSYSLINEFKPSYKEYGVIFNQGYNSDRYHLLLMINILNDDLIKT
jgi:hypothetical protein